MPCKQCGKCCVNPSVSIKMDEQTAFFYSNFGIEVSDGIAKFITGTVCKHATTVDGRCFCTIYGNRPDICRNFNCEGE